MDALTVALGALLVAILSYLVLEKSEDRSPPGPFAYPLIGNLPQIILAGTFPKFLERCRRKYGNVST